MSPRLPFLALIALLVSGALLLSQGDAPSGDPAASAAPVRAVAEETGGTTWFCAGGTAAPGGFADHTVVIANAGADEAEGRLSVVPGGFDGLDADTGPRPRPGDEATVVSAPVRLRVGERVRVRLGDLVVAPLAGAVVEMDRGTVTVDHEVRGPLGEDSAACHRRGASTWHFAWGTTTRDARHVLLLFNPYANDVAVDAVFTTESGVREPVRWQGLSVPAHSVVGVDVGADVTRREQVSTTLHVRGGQLLVDRIQVFDGALGTTGMSLAAGTTEPGPSWAFADGRVEPGGSEQVVLYNPGPLAAEVDVTVHDESSPAPFGVVVRPGRYEVLALEHQNRVARATPHAITVESRNGIPVVAERVAVANGRIAAEPGRPQPTHAWTFTGRAGQRYAVFNPDGDRAARVTLGVREAGTGSLARLRGVEVGPEGRVELTAPDDRPVTVLVESDRPVVAEQIP